MHGSPSSSYSMVSGGSEIQLPVTSTERVRMELQALPRTSADKLQAGEI